MPRQTPGRTLGSERTVAERLAYERRIQGLTYDAVSKRMEAEGCPIQVSALHKVEKGDPPRRVTLDEAIAMASALGLTLQQLVEPMAIVEERRGRELAAEIRRATDDLTESARRQLRAFIELADLQTRNPEVFEFVLHQHAARGQSSFEWFPKAEFGEIDAADLVKVSQLLSDVFNYSMKAATNASERSS